MDRFIRHRAIESALSDKFVTGRSKQVGIDPRDFSFTHYSEFRGTKAELIEAIEAALDAEED